VQASLMLGGYDSSRFSLKNLTLPFYNDVARRFVVEFTKMKYILARVSTITTPITLMPETISMYTDSTIPFIYLPTSICSKFESEFGLQWDVKLRNLHRQRNTTHRTTKREPKYHPHNSQYCKPELGHHPLICHLRPHSHLPHSLQPLQHHRLNSLLSSQKSRQ